MVSLRLFELRNEGKVWAWRFWLLCSIAWGLVVAGLALFCVVVGIVNHKPFVSMCGAVVYMALLAYFVFELGHWRTINH